jgi:NAD(P)-dependent dehydrogenase (short-subunit alcohol dehydrogenase family)
MPLLTDRVVLVTGASRGIGAAVALACAAEGARLVLVARTRGGLEEVDDRVRAQGAPEPTLVQLDLTKGELVDALGPALYQKHGRLDGLVACAGQLGRLSPVPHLEPKALERLYALNVLANHRLIRTLDPLLRASDAGRAVFLTDSRASVGPAFWGGYGATKAALDVMVRAWAAESARITRLRVNLVDPGPVRTRLREDAYPGERAELLPTPAEVATRIVPLLAPAWDRCGELVTLARDS